MNILILFLTIYISYNFVRYTKQYIYERYILYRFCWKLISNINAFKDTIYYK